MFGLLWILAICGVWGAEERQPVKFVLEKFEEPVVYGCRQLELTGEARISIAILIDEKGSVNDWMPLVATDRVLVNSISEVIGSWKFRPSIQDGEAVWAYGEVEILFQQRGSVLNLSMTETIQSLYNFDKFNPDKQLVFPFAKLDKIPAPIQMDAPKIHKSLLKPGAGNTVKFEFFIDEKGNVRMPRLKEADMDMTAAGIILEKLLLWKFETPTVNGVPVATRASLPFTVK
jgi:hypothetical protein